LDWIKIRLGYVYPPTSPEAAGLGTCIKCPERIGTAVAVGVFTLGVGALIALSKSKKHYIGLIWADGDKKGGLALQCDKNDYRGILAGLEGVSGKKAVDSETMTVKN
jgi:hypothetical protein